MRRHLSIIVEGVSSAVFLQLFKNLKLKPKFLNNRKVFRTAFQGFAVSWEHDQMHFFLGLISSREGGGVGEGTFVYSWYKLCVNLTIN